MSTARVSVSLSLRVGGDVVRVEVDVPAGPARLDDILPALQVLEDAVMRQLAAGVERAGRSISCGPRCGACCRQLVPISDVEARHLAGLVQALPDEARHGVERRFVAAAERFAELGLLERLHDAVTLDEREERRRLGLEYFAAGVPCPFLVDESCSIHADRPLACREYLVTSPPERCTQPRPGEIEHVPIPARLSTALMRTAADGAATSPRWLPLVLALEGAAPPDAPARTGPELLRDVITRAFGAA